MKKIQIRTTIKNKSRFAIDLVWENAQDLEHVAYLHSKTNKGFRLLYAGPEKGSSPSSTRPYDILVYRAVRRFYFAGLASFGFRKIIADYHIHQFEQIPLLGISSTLNSLLFRTADPEFPTLMVDEVVMEIPAVFSFLKNWLIRSLHHHAAIQCQDDEPFRERRALLQKKEIRLPLSLFNRSHWSELTSQFVQRLHD